MRNFKLILALAAALGATGAVLQAEDEKDDQPAARKDPGRRCCRRNRQGRRFREGRGREKAREGCRREDGRGRGGRFRRGRRGGCDDGAAQPGRGNRRGQGGCVLEQIPKPAAPATPEYLKRLQQALASEVDAHAYYAAAAKSLAGPRRFSNLARAEERHAQAIRSVITAFGGKPVEPKPPEVVAPKTLAEADAHCREIEHKVIELYAKLIADCPDKGVRQVLERIQTANRRHLQAVGG